MLSVDFYAIVVGIILGILSHSKIIMGSLLTVGLQHVLNKCVTQFYATMRIP